MGGVRGNALRGYGRAACLADNLVRMAVRNALAAGKAVRVRRA